MSLRRPFMDDFESDSFFNSPRGLRFPTFPSLPDPFFFSDRRAVEHRPTNNHRQSNRHLAERHAFHSMSMWPFGGGDTFRRMFDDFDGMANDPNAHTFSSSSVMMYSSNGTGEQPRYYQAASSSNKAPGGIRETRKAVRDSESGLQKMSVGHHIGDRGHILEHTINHKTGDREDRKDFLNMDESDGHAFAKEWEKRAKPYNRVYQGLTYKPKAKTHRQERSAVDYCPPTPPNHLRVKTPAHGMTNRNVQFEESVVRPSGPTLNGQRARKSKSKKATIDMDL